MKITDVLVEKTQTPRPRNFVAKNAMKTTSGAGKHKDKKKAAKQGDVKHKGKVSEGIGGTIAGGVGQFIGNKIDPLAGEIMRAHGEIAGRKAEYTIRKYMHLLQKALKQQLDSSDGSNESTEEGRKDYGYDSFGNSLRPGDDEGSTEPPNNFAIYINGKKWKVFQGRGQYADDQYEMQQFRQLQAMAARKSQETGKKWEVSRTLEPATK